MARLVVPKTYKLFIGGSFPRTESGRSMPIDDRHGRTMAHLCRASRKDLRNAVEAARGALPGWSGATAYNRGQVLYRMAEMLEGRSAEFAAAITAVGPGPAPRSRSRRPSASAEVAAAVDRLVSFAGWTDKLAQVLGCRNPVAGPYHVFSLPEPTGVVAIVAPDDPPLLGLVSLLAAPLCAGNAVVVLAGERNPVPAAILSEVVATSDVPAGAVNILTGFRDELLPHLAGHREIRAVGAADVAEEEATALRLGMAENLKRVSIEPRGSLEAWMDHERETAPDRIEPFVEIKTIWHPSAG